MVALNPPLKLLTWVEAEVAVTQRHCTEGPESKRRFRLLALAIALSPVTTSVSAQVGGRMDVEQTPSCRDCSILLARHTVLEKGPGGQGFSEAVQASATQSGAAFYVADWLTYPSQIFVIDSAGVPKQSVGRAGQGPGEFQNLVVPLPQVGDSLRVYDPKNRSISVFDGQLRFTRRYRIPTPLGHSFVLFPDGSLLLATPRFLTDSGIGYPLHIFDRDGHHVRSFGKSVRSATPGTYFSDSRLVTIRDADAVWVAHVYRYEIELWSRTGQQLITLRREAGWFPPHREGTLLELPRPEITGMFQDEHNLLWVFVAVPSSRPVPPVRQRPGRAEDGQYVSRSDANVIFDTVIEVIDPSARRLVTSTIVEGRLYMSGQSNLVSRYEETAGLEARLVVLRTKLVRGHR